MDNYFTYQEKSPLLIEVLGLMSKYKDIDSAISVLGWDQETYMPPGSVDVRSNQIATLEVLAHQVLISPSAVEIGNKIRNINVVQTPFEKSMFRLFLREHDKAVKLPDHFIKQLSEARTIALETWKRARKESDFALFKNDLANLIELKIREAEYLGYKDNRYNAALDYHEPETSTEMLDPIFDELKIKTANVLKMIEPVKENVTDSYILNKKYPSYEQVKLTKIVAQRLSFDFYYGRIDHSIHPFTAAFGPKDVRLTTRTNENDFRTCLYSTIHELGHGLYEQGVDYDLYRTFASEGASFGLHESQSLIWENMISRSREFFIWILPLLREHFPGNFHEITPTDLYQAVNIVRPSFLRIEADELTYNQHIIIRYEIEKDIFNGKLRIKDIPDAWNEKCKLYLGIVPPNDTLGCLQDIHWAHGSFGYFPSYTIGKLYAALIWNTMNEQIKDLKGVIMNGNFTTIRNWLKEKIYRFGKLETPGNIVLQATGSKITVDPFMDYITEKVKTVYKIS